VNPRRRLHRVARAGALAAALAAACTPREAGEDEAASSSAPLAAASSPRARVGAPGRLDPALVAELEADDAPSVGAVGAELVLVAFGDFASPHCARASAIAALVEREYGARVRFVFRQLPSASPVAELAATASLEAHAQGRFWTYHDVLFANQRALERASLERYAAELGLDRARFSRALGGGAHAAALERDRELASLAGVVRAPALFADGERVRVPTDLVALRELVVARLARPDE